MREAPSIPIIEALLAKGAKVQAYDPEAMKIAKGIFGNEDHLHVEELRRAQGRRRAGGDHRVAGVPRARLRAHEEADAHAGRLRRPQHLPARRDDGAGLHVLFDRTLSVARVVVTGGAGYIGSHAVRALVDAGHAVAVVDDLSAGHAEAVPRGVTLTRCRDPRRRRRAARARRASRRRRDAFCGVAGRRRIGAQAARVLPEQRRRHAGGARGDARRGRQALRVFLDLRRLRRAGLGADCRDACRRSRSTPYGETKLAIERALPHLEAAHGLKWIALRYFNAAGAHPDGTIGEDHGHEIHLIPLAIRAATGGPALRVFGEDYPTPDGTCLRDYIHVCDLAEAHLCALAALERGGAVGGV